MRTDKLLIKIVDLVLTSDDASADWINVTVLRRCFYLSTILLILFILLLFVGQTTQLSRSLHSSVVGTEIYRSLMLLLSLGGGTAEIATAFFYYRYILSKGIAIYLSNVLAFYSYSVFYFGLSYFYLYLLSPNSFLYESPEATVSPTMTTTPGLFRVHFLLFSAFQSVNGNYYRIHANSALASIITYFQTLFTLALITLLIASYVNQKTNKAST